MMNKQFRKKKKISAGDVVLKIIAYTYFIIFSLCILIPFYIMLKNSLTSEVENLTSMSFSWIPKMGITFEAYQTALFSDVLDAYGISILRGFFNTLWQTLPTLLIGLFVSGLAAFAYSKLRVPGKNKFFMVMLTTMMIPGAVLTMPAYVFYDTIGWSNTVLPIIIPGMFGGATTIFFLRQFFKGIPSDLLDAAKLDGLGFMGMYVKIMIPLAKPAFISQFIFGFIGGYNNYMGPLLYLNGQPNLYPLQMALTLYRGVYGGEPAVVAALTILALVPLLIIYICMQKFFIEGIATSGIKG